MVALVSFIATVATSNVASLRVLQKCGFVVERVLLSPDSDRYPECEVAELVVREKTAGWVRPASTFNHRPSR